MILYSCNLMQNSWIAELNTRKIRNIQKRRLMLMLSYDWTGPWGGCSIPGHQPEPSEHDEVPGQPQGSGPHQQDGHQVRGQTTGRRRGTHGLKSWNYSELKMIETCIMNISVSCIILKYLYSHTDSVSSLSIYDNILVYKVLVVGILHQIWIFITMYGILELLLQ